jgi:hypothetical protein
LTAWKGLVGDQWNTDSGRQIVWRSRAADSSKMLVDLLSLENVSEEESARYLRALDYQDATKREAALKELLGDAGGE